MSRQESDLRLGGHTVSCPLQQANLTVLVIRGDSKQPVEGATVALVRPVAVSRTTSAAGTVRFDALDEGTYALQVSAPAASATLFTGPVAVEKVLTGGRTLNTIVELGARVFLRLNLMRGTVPRTGRCKVKLLSAEDGREENVLATLDSVDIFRGTLHIAATAAVARDARFAWIYFLNDSGHETGEGLSLAIAATRPIATASTRIQILRALGFNEKEPFAGDPNAVQRLELDLALARFQRTQGDTIAADDADLQGVLEARYLDYLYVPSALPRLTFT